MHDVASVDEPAAKVTNRGLEERRSEIFVTFFKKQRGKMSKKIIKRTRIF
jgi:hypothetical protein